MYVRMADGRERGQVLDMVEDVGRAMLANGQALPVDFDEPDPLGARELKAIEPVSKIQVRSAGWAPRISTGHFKKKSSR
jgi:hypothetical protein